MGSENRFFDGRSRLGERDSRRTKVKLMNVLIGCGDMCYEFGYGVSSGSSGCICRMLYESSRSTPKGKVV